MRQLLKVWFPDLYTECHRSPARSKVLVKLLRSYGIGCQAMRGLRLNKQGIHLSKQSCICDVVFCGSHMALTLPEEFNPPTVHFCWDFYPAVLTQPLGHNPGEISKVGWDDMARHLHYAWKRYRNELIKATMVLAPTDSAARRVAGLTNRDVVVINPPIHPWEAKVVHGPKVVDVMRKYDWDINNRVVRDACKELNLPCLETERRMPTNDFHREISSARLLVSAYREASTGGLTLLEGYRLGKRVLLSDSEWQGGCDLFGDRACYFKWNSKEDLKRKITELYNLPPRTKKEVKEAREWVDSTYNDRRFAGELAQCLMSASRQTLIGSGKLSSSPTVQSG